MFTSTQRGGWLIKVGLGTWSGSTYSRQAMIAIFGIWVTRIGMSSNTSLQQLVQPTQVRPWQAQQWWGNSNTSATRIWCDLVRFRHLCHKTGILRTPHIIAAGPPYGIEKSSTALSAGSVNMCHYTMKRLTYAMDWTTPTILKESANNSNRLKSRLNSCLYPSFARRASSLVSFVAYGAAFLALIDDIIPRIKNRGLSQRKESWLRSTDQSISSCQCGDEMWAPAE